MSENPEKIRKCEYCGVVFDSKRKLGGHIAAKHRLKFCNVCGRYIISGNYNKHLKCCENIHKSYYCKKCGKLVTKKFGSGIFCSRKCANSHMQTDEQNKRRSLKAKQHPTGFANISYILRRKQNRKPPNSIYCKVCGEEKPLDRLYNQTCCKQCQKLLKEWNSIGNKSGGYREGSGRSKHGYYKGIKCDSTYELVYLIYCLDHNINIKRFEKRLEYNNQFYYPDFIVDNKIIEIKGIDSQNVKKQIYVAQNCGYKIEVKYKKDLQKEFDYVKHNYTYKQLQDLFDKCKERIFYNCDYCGKQFYKYKLIKTKSKFCCRSCAGKYNRFRH